MARCNRGSCTSSSTLPFGLALTGASVLLAMMASEKSTSPRARMPAVASLIDRLLCLSSCGGLQFPEAGHPSEARGDPANGVFDGLWRRAFGGPGEGAALAGAGFLVQVVDHLVVGPIRRGLQQSREQGGRCRLVQAQPVQHLPVDGVDRERVRRIEEGELDVLPGVVQCKAPDR